MNAVHAKGKVVSTLSPPSAFPAPYQRLAIKPHSLTITSMNYQSITQCRIRSEVRYCWLPGWAWYAWDGRGRTSSSGDSIVSGFVPTIFPVLYFKLSIFAIVGTTVVGCRSEPSSINQETDLGRTKLGVGLSSACPNLRPIIGKERYALERRPMLDE